MPPDIGRVVRKVFELKQAGKPQEATALVSWLSGSANVSSTVKNLAGIKGAIESSDSMAYLRGILEIVKRAGYKGLVSSSIRQAKVLPAPIRDISDSLNQPSFNELEEAGPILGMSISARQPPAARC